MCPSSRGGRGWGGAGGGAEREAPAGVADVLAWHKQGLVGSKDARVVEPGGDWGGGQEDRQPPSLQDRGTSKEQCADLRALEGEGAGWTGLDLGFYCTLLAVL